MKAWSRLGLLAMVGVIALAAGCDGRGGASHLQNPAALNGAKAPFYGADAMRFFDYVGEMPGWAKDSFFIEADRYKNRNGQFPEWWHAAKNQHYTITGKFPTWSMYDGYFEEFFASRFDKECYFSDATCLERNSSPTLKARMKARVAAKGTVNAQSTDDYDWQYDSRYDAYYYVDGCFDYYDDGWYFDRCYDEWTYDGWFYDHRTGEWYNVPYSDEWYEEPYYDVYYEDACYYYDDCYDDGGYVYYDWWYYDDYYYGWDDWWGYDYYTDYWYYDDWDSYYYADAGYYYDDSYYYYDYGGYDYGYGCYDYYCKGAEPNPIVEEFQKAKEAFWAAKQLRK